MENMSDELHITTNLLDGAIDTRDIQNYGHTDSSLTFTHTDTGTQHIDGSDVPHTSTTRDVISRGAQRGPEGLRGA